MPFFVALARVPNNGVTTAKIVDNAVTGAKIAMGSDAQGDVLYYNGTDYARLGAGASGQFLKTNGVGANPAWTTSISDIKFLGGNLSTTTSTTEAELTNGTLSISLGEFASSDMFLINLMFNTPSNTNSIKLRINDGTNNIDISVASNATGDSYVGFCMGGQGTSANTSGVFGGQFQGSGGADTNFGINNASGIANWITQALTFSVRGSTSIDTLRVRWTVYKIKGA